MQLKTHIVFVSIIVLAMFGIWFLMYGEQEKKAPVVISGYAIEIVRASYGLQCNDTYGSPAANANDPYADNIRKKVQENNVLTVVSELCNSKQECAVPVNSTVLQLDPDPSCAMKDLQVEYRCYTVDRLHRISAQETQTLHIKCTK